MSVDLLYIIGQVSMGGQERQLATLLKGLVLRGIRPSLVVWNLETSNELLPEIEALGVDVHGFAGGSPSRGKLRQIADLVRRQRPRLIHSYSFYTNIVARLCGTGAVPAVGSIRADFGYSLASEGRLLGRLSARWPRAMICNSRSAKSGIASTRSWFKPCRVYVVRNGLDIGSFPRPTGPPDRPHVVGVGRLVDIKRWDLLLGACARLRAAGYAFRLTIAGDGPLRATLDAEIDRLGLRGTAELAGYQADVVGLLARSTALALTSDAEGCPNAVMEAMAAGRPVVATAVGDVPDLVEEGETGLVVPTGDEDALAQALMRLLSDPRESRRMGENARAKAEREFNLGTLVDNTLEVYRAEGWA